MDPEMDPEMANQKWTQKRALSYCSTEVARAYYGVNTAPLLNDAGTIGQPHAEKGN